MKTTEELYREDPKTWSELAYKDALMARIGFAMEAMEYYRDKAYACGNGESDKWLSKYAASEIAKDFNVKLLEEILDEQ